MKVLSINETLWDREPWQSLHTDDWDELYVLMLLRWTIPGYGDSRPGRPYEEAIPE